MLTANSILHSSFERPAVMLTSFLWCILKIVCWGIFELHTLNNDSLSGTCCMSGFIDSTFESSTSAQIFYVSICAQFIWIHMAFFSVTDCQMVHFHCHLTLSSVTLIMMLPFVRSHPVAQGSGWISKVCFYCICKWCAMCSQLQIGTAPSVKRPALYLATHGLVVINDLIDENRQRPFRLIELPIECGHCLCFLTHRQTAMQLLLWWRGCCRARKIASPMSKAN